MSGCGSSTNVVPATMIFGPEMSFQAPISSFVKGEESDMDDDTIHQLASYYGPTLKSLSE